MVSIDKPKHTHAVLDHHRDMVALREEVFMLLNAARASKKKVFIVTAATDADTDIVLS